MLMCVIEFATLPGMEERNRELVRELLVEAAKNPGFVSKESFTSRDNPGKVITISYWQDEASLRAWMRDPAHRRTIPIGRNELFSHYSIQIAEIQRGKNWRKDGGTSD